MPSLDKRGVLSGVFAGYMSTFTPIVVLPNTPEESLEGAHDPLFPKTPFSEG